MGQPDPGKKCRSGARPGAESAQVQILGRAEGTGCSRGGASSDRNLNYVVTQALGSLGPSFLAQPDLLQLDLGRVSKGWRETQAGHPFPPGTGGKRKLERMGERQIPKKGRGGWCSLLWAPPSLLPTPCWGGSWPGRWLLFIPAPSLGSCLRLGRPNPQLSSELFFCLSLPPSILLSLNSVCFATFSP